MDGHGAWGLPVDAGPSDDSAPSAGFESDEDACPVVSRVVQERMASNHQAGACGGVGTVAGAPGNTAKTTSGNAFGHAALQCPSGAMPVAQPLTERNVDWTPVDGIGSSGAHESQIARFAAALQRGAQRLGAQLLTRNTLRVTTVADMTAAAQRGTQRCIVRIRSDMPRKTAQVRPEFSPVPFPHV
jgi:hypothetical protein